MGGGRYSLHNRKVRSTTSGYHTKSASEIFTQRTVHKDMNPVGVAIRESRDSEEHPNSVPIILALDVTGSMQRIPHEFVKDGLPQLMGTIIQGGIADPQLLFLAIGDHENDRSPLQVGQFESSDELLDKWLTSVWLEGGGGGNDGESYMLAHYFAANHTIHDAYEKRGKKGFLFTIGDEPCLKAISRYDIKTIMGDGQYGDYKTVDLIEKAKEKYHVYHFHVAETRTGSDPRTIEKWKDLLGQNVIVVKDYHDIPKKMVDIILQHVDDTGVSVKPVEQGKPQTDATSDTTDYHPVL